MEQRYEDDAKGYFRTSLELGESPEVICSKLKTLSWWGSLSKDAAERILTGTRPIEESKDSLSSSIMELDSDRFTIDQEESDEDQTIKQDTNHEHEWSSRVQEEGIHLKDSIENRNDTDLSSSFSFSSSEVSDLSESEEAEFNKELEGLNHEDPSLNVFIVVAFGRCMNKKGVQMTCESAKEDIKKVLAIPNDQKVRTQFKDSIRVFTDPEITNQKALKDGLRKYLKSLKNVRFLIVLVSGHASGGALGCPDGSEITTLKFLELINENDHLKLTPKMVIFSLCRGVKQNEENENLEPLIPEYNPEYENFLNTWIIFLSAQDYVAPNNSYFTKFFIKRLDSISRNLNDDSYISKKLRNIGMKLQGMYKYSRFYYDVKLKVADPIVEVSIKGFEEFFQGVSTYIPTEHVQDVMDMKTKCQERVRRERKMTVGEPPVKSQLSMQRTASDETASSSASSAAMRDESTHFPENPAHVSAGVEATEFHSSTRHHNQRRTYHYASIYTIRGPVSPPSSPEIQGPSQLDSTVLSAKPT